MPKYNVLLARAYWHHATIEVEADCPAHAESIALEKLDDTELKLGEAFEGHDFAEVQSEVK